MKKLVRILLLQVLVLFGFNPISGQQIVDETLRSAISITCSTCLDSNGNLLSEAVTIKALLIPITLNTAVRTTKGLEGFKNLEILNFSTGNQSLTHNVDSLPPKVSDLQFTNGRFGKMKQLPPNLIELRFNGWYVDSIFPPLPKSLRRLRLHSNDIVSLPKLPDSLRFLTVTSTSLKFLPSFPNFLQMLELSAGVSFNTPLSNYQLSSIPVLPPNITHISIDGFKQLKSISNLPNSLKSLELVSTQLFQPLKVPLPNQLEKLLVVETSIECVPMLPNSIRFLTLHNISCLPNIPTALDTVELYVGATFILRVSEIIICNRTNNTCQYPANISGKVFYDLNNNGVQNANEPNAKVISLKSTDNGLIGLTDTMGSYNLIGDSLKTYTFSPIFSNNYFKIVPVSRTITTTNAIAQRFDSLDFAIQSLGTFPDIATSITVGEARPGFNSISTLTYKNVGTTILNGTITLTIDAKQTFVSADIPPTTQNGNILTWNYTNLQLFDFKNINITLKTALTAPLSSLAISTVNGTITGASDANPLNNSETTQITVRGSYDPNDKQVDKVSIPTVTAIATTPLTYTIRFQNTGNAEAIRVEVVDTLTKKLDITTIEMLGASHPYEMKIVSDSGKVKDFTVVKWTFDGIYLPDSTSNEKGSHGFIKYRIKNDTKKMGLTVDSILNKAAIYFDFNPPIITNTARTLFNPRVATVELKDLGLNVFPNPVSNILTISSTHKNEQELTIDVVNTNGQVLMRQVLRGQNPQINVQELAAGLYFLKIKTSEGIGIVKIVKE